MQIEEALDGIRPENVGLFSMEERIRASKEVQHETDRAFKVVNTFESRVQLSKKIQVHALLHAMDAKIQTWCTDDIQIGAVSLGSGNAADSNVSTIQSMQSLDEGLRRTRLVGAIHVGGSPA